MAPQSEASDVGAAWKALQSGEGDAGAGWRTIPLLREGAWRLNAGIRFPGREEAVLVGFASVSSVRNEDLPRGAGFQVERTPALEEPGARAWFALTRAAAASLELFTAMVEDVARLLTRNREQPEQRLLHLFLGRIRAWQSFMSKPARGVLGPEAELGLFGELVVLEGILDQGVPAELAVEGWQGPLQGVQDFTFGTGAIEVKTTLAAAGFPARISSLEQLDDALVNPIFLAGVRAVLQDGGVTLPERIAALRGRLGPSGVVFNMRLLHGGYDDEHAAEYTRRFTVSGVHILEVDAGLPRLTRTGLPVAIRSAEYHLDLDQLGAGGMPLTEVLNRLGY